MAAPPLAGPISDLSRYPEHLKALGEIVVAWASLEAELLVYASHLFGNSSIAQTMLHSLANFTAKVDILRNVGREVLPEPTSSRVADFFDGKVAQTARRRNTFVHCAWIEPDTGGPDPALVIVRPSSKVRNQTRVVTLAEMTELVSAIRQIEKELTWIGLLVGTKVGETNADYLAQMRAEYPDIDALVRTYE